MMYDLMIEQYEEERAAYCATRDAMLAEGYFGTALQVVNAKIGMCNEFIAFLRRCERQEIELDEENERISKESE